MSRCYLAWWTLVGALSLYMMVCTSELLFPTVKNLSGDEANMSVCLSECVKIVCTWKTRSVLNFRSSLSPDSVRLVNGTSLCSLLVSVVRAVLYECLINMLISCFLSDLKAAEDVNLFPPLLSDSSVLHMNVGVLCVVWSPLTDQRSFISTKAVSTQTKSASYSICIYMTTNSTFYSEKTSFKEFSCINIKIKTNYKQNKIFWSKCFE